MENIIDALKEITFEVDLGVNIELKAYFEAVDDIDSYCINIEDSDHYLINIKLKEFSLSKILEQFDDFMKFMRYGHLNLYFKIEAEDVINIKYYTVNNKKTDIFFNIFYN